MYLGRFFRNSSAVSLFLVRLILISLSEMKTFHYAELKLFILFFSCVFVCEKNMNFSHPTPIQYKIIIQLENMDLRFTVNIKEVTVKHKKNNLKVAPKGIRNVT